MNNNQLAFTGFAACLLILIYMFIIAPAFEEDFIVDKNYFYSIDLDPVQR